MSVSKYKINNTTKWLVRFRIYDTNGNLIKNSSKKNFETRKEAKAYESSLVGKVGNTFVSFDDAVEHYLEYYKSHNKYSSYRSSLNAVKLHIKPFFKGKDIFKVTPKNILDWKMVMQNKGNYSVNYLNKIKAQVVAIFNHFVKYYNLEKSPCMNIEGFKGRGKKQEMSFWTLSEFNKFISQVDDPLHHLFFNILFYTGIRKGEAQALQWKDININKNTLTISKTWQAIGDGKYSTTSPKTINAYRNIKLDSNLLKSLNNQYIEANKYSGYNDEFYIFGDITPLSTSQWDRTFTKYLKLCNCKPIRMHDLRHSNASLLISLGADIILITKRLGHASSQETYDTYGHLYPDKQDEIIEKIENCSLTVPLDK